jgi:hypothetical protein
MKCESMLTAMLDAEPDELAGRGNSALAIHVRECARCSAVAGQLLGDAHEIVVAASAVSGATHSQPRLSVGPARHVRRLAVGGVLAAAALAVFALQHQRSPSVTPLPVASGSNPAGLGTGSTPAAEPQPVAPQPAPPRPAEPQPAASLASHGASRVGAPIPTGKPSFIGVAVAANVRATVMRTRNPKFTVVWLY